MLPEFAFIGYILSRSAEIPVQILQPFNPFSFE